MRNPDKPAFCLRLRDFVPLKGIREYLERNGEGLFERTEDGEYLWDLNYYFIRASAGVDLLATYTSIVLGSAGMGILLGITGLVKLLS